MVGNYPLTTKYSVIADHIYGPARPLLQGGMKQNSNPDIKVPIIPLPSYISLNHKDIKLYIYLFHINGIPFLHIKSYKITFITAENFNSRIAAKIIQEIDTVENIYPARGFNISIYNRNNELYINALQETIRTKSLKYAQEDATSQSLNNLFKPSSK